LLAVSFAAVVAAAGSASTPPENVASLGKLVHVVVALCDNKYQGIVPVPAKIGNGDDPANNLYWGAAYGVKTFFSRAGDWALVSSVSHPKPGVLERCLFKHRSKAVYLLADAYRGRDIRKSTYDFLRFAGGRDVEVLESREGPKPIRLNAGGAADLVAYVGHNGLMDFSLPDVQGGTSGGSRGAIILACASKPYFAGPLRKSGASPLLWTTNLMAPEAYTLKAAVDGWILGEAGEAIRRRAAEAYNQHQKCGMSAALKLFSTGW
jgi:hypothetical protein